jgi:hypothetical protein
VPVNRAVDVHSDVLYVVTDLHGAWEPYARCRDHFLALRERGHVDRFLLLGDVIHGYGPPETDRSVEILLDLMRLQAELGDDAVTLLLGNHEFSHLYYKPLVKGDIAFAPRFQRAVGEHREAIREFLLDLPFVVRTAGGVLLTHAGASAETATPDAAKHLLAFSHRAVFQEIERLLSRADVWELLEEFGLADEDEYRDQAMLNMAVEDPDDPRYLDLMRGYIAGSLKPEWSLLWEFFFTQCEHEYGTRYYRRILDRFLKAYSPPDMPQRVMVTGHIVINGGYTVVAENQFRLASWTHARPHQSGRILLYPANRPIKQASDLTVYLRPLPWGAALP